MEISAAYLASQLCAALAMRSVNLCCTTLWSNLCLRIGFLAVFGFCKLVFLKIFFVFYWFSGCWGGFGTREFFVSLPAPVALWSLWTRLATTTSHSGTVYQNYKYHSKYYVLSCGTVCILQLYVNTELRLYLYFTIVKYGYLCRI